MRAKTSTMGSEKAALAACRTCLTVPCGEKRVTWVAGAGLASYERTEEGREEEDHGRSLHEGQPSRNFRSPPGPAPALEGRPWRVAGPAALARFAGPACPCRNA